MFFEEQIRIRFYIEGRIRNPRMYKIQQLEMLKTKLSLSHTLSLTHSLSVSRTHTNPFFPSQRLTLATA